MRPPPLARVPRLVVPLYPPTYAPRGWVTELSRIKPVINRSHRKDPEATLREHLAGIALDPAGGRSAYGGALLTAPEVVRDKNELRIFAGIGEPLSQEAIEDLAPLARRIRG